MSKNYELTRRDFINGFEEYYIHIETNNKEFLEYIDKGLDKLIADYEAKS